MESAQEVKSIICLRAYHACTLVRNGGLNVLKDGLGTVKQDQMGLSATRLEKAQYSRN